MTSLLDLLKQRYLETLRSVNSRWKILVVDEHSHMMLKSVLTTFDILEEGVQQVDIITSRRSDQPRLEAIYLLMPTSQNVELILRDYRTLIPSQVPLNSNGKIKKGKEPAPVYSTDPPKYAAAHLHFVDGIDDDLVSKLTAGLPENYLKALTELYVNFHALEPRTFTLKSPRSFFSLYAPPDRSPQESLDLWEEEIGFMSKALVNTLATLGEYPLIRYYNPPSSFHAVLGPGKAAGEHVAKRLALRVQQEIDLYARDNTDFPPKPDPPRDRGVLFITDRSMDLYAPLLHEFTYQAMCNDLLDIEDGTKYHYSFRNASGDMEEKEAILTEEDKIWTEVRHMHMKDALDKLGADFKAYAGEHGARFNSDGGTSLNDMRDMMASLPQLKETKEKFSIHLSMAETCMGLFQSKKLPIAAGVEQCCATGTTPEGKTPKTLVEEMVPLLDDRSVSSTDKMRIIALYIMYQDGVPESDKKRLYQHARLALHEMDALDNLTYLGVNVSKDSGKKRKPMFKQRDDEDAYDISRYQPVIKNMLEGHVSGTLDQTHFPYVKDAPVVSSSSSRGLSSTSAPGSLRSARPQWTSSRSRKNVAEPRQRVIVFVAGGLTYSEVRVAYRISEGANKDIFIGSTDIITPKQFIQDLSNLDRGAGASLKNHDNTANSYKTTKSSKNSVSLARVEVSQSAQDRRYASQPQQSQSQSQYQQDPYQQSSSSSSQQQNSYQSSQPQSSSRQPAVLQRSSQQQQQQRPYSTVDPRSGSQRPPPMSNSNNGGGGGYYPSQGQPMQQQQQQPQTQQPIVDNTKLDKNGKKKKSWF